MLTLMLQEEEELQRAGRTNEREGPKAPKNSKSLNKSSTSFCSWVIIKLESRGFHTSVDQKEGKRNFFSLQVITAY